MRASEAAKALHVTYQTVTRWAKEGKVQFTTTPGGHRRYEVTNPQDKVKDERRFIAYARVSSKKQEADLERQALFIAERYPDHEIIREIGSGINYERPHFKTILEQLFRGNIAECVVCSNDRFARYGGFFEWLFTQFDSKLTSIHVRESGGPEDLADDLMEIITVFAARYHGRRRYTAGEEDSDISDEESAPAIR